MLRKHLERKSHLQMESNTKCMAKTRIYPFQLKFLAKITYGVAPDDSSLSSDQDINQFLV